MPHQHNDDAYDGSNYPNHAQADDRNDDQLRQADTHLNLPIVNVEQPQPARRVLFPHPLQHCHRLLDALEHFLPADHRHGFEQRRADGLASHRGA